MRLGILEYDGQWGNEIYMVAIYFILFYFILFIYLFIYHLCSSGCEILKEKYGKERNCGTETENQVNKKIIK